MKTNNGSLRAKYSSPGMEGVIVNTADDLVAIIKSQKKNKARKIKVVQYDSFFIEAKPSFLIYTGENVIESEDVDNIFKLLDSLGFEIMILPKKDKEMATPDSTQ